MSAVSAALSAAQVFVDQLKSADAAPKTEINIAVADHTTFHISVKTSKEMCDFANKKTISVKGADGQNRDINIQAGDANWVPEFFSIDGKKFRWYWPRPGNTHHSRKLSLNADELDWLVKVMVELKRQFIASPPASIGTKKSLKI